MRWLLVALATAALFTGAIPNAPPRIVGDLVGIYNGSTDGSTYAIGAITRTDGVWTVDAGNPVLQKGANTTWDDATVKDPYLIWDGTQYVMYYAGLDGTNYRIGRATASSVGGPWTKYASNPVLNLGSGGAFDDAGLIFPTVLYDVDATPKWKMWYGAGDGSNHTIGYAYSSDGLSWTKHGQVIGLGSGGSWNDERVIPGGIVRVGSTYYLFAAGAQNPSGNSRWQTGVWTFTDPTGTYTPSASNPILTARYNTSGTSQALTANTSSGSAVVTVTSTAAWNVGEPMVLDDGNSDPLVSEILTIDSATQVTLSETAAADYTTAQSAVIRPLAYNSVTPRSVWRSGTQWVMAVTPFQSLRDLTSSHLAEGSMLATASDPEGPFTLDYATGLIVPLSGGWDANSAENLSVLPAP